MSAPYAPQQPKKLARSTTNKYVGGVCGGLADYLNMDANLVRILTVVATLITGGAAIVVYLIALFLLPEDRAVQPPPSVQAPAPSDAVWGQQGPPWAQPQTQPAPATAAPAAAPTAATVGESSAQAESTAPSAADASDEERRDLR